MAVEEKWKANLEKVAFMKQFPGLVGTWEAVAGKVLQAVIPLKGKPGAAVLVCSDGAFAIVPPMAPEPSELGEALTVARTLLEPVHQTAYVEYDRLVQKDKDALKAARVDKILGAIQNNLAQHPELKDRLKALVKEWQ
jgi:diglucosylglycerate octanoyltransferase